MENAADALKIAFAILVFVIAITLTFTMISKVKATADTVFYYADNTNFRAHSEYSGENRVVSTTDVISTLYRYYNESIAIKIIINDGEEPYIFDKGNESIMEDINLSKINTEEQAEENLASFITNILNELPDDAKFAEEFVEVPTSGKYITGSDGSQITVTSGGKKIYITYKEQ